MKKLLIYFPKEKLLPKGGPAGYLYNLKKGLDGIEFSDIQISFYNNLKKQLEDNKVLRDRIPKRIKDIRRLIKFSRYLKKKYSIDETLFKYDMIHFHSTEDMYLNRKFLENYQGKVILTSHTPCAPYKEIIGRLNPIDYKLHKKRINKLIEMDIYAFKRADYIIFPCKEAEEPYYHTFENYDNIRDDLKYRYLLTGNIEAKTNVNRKQIREKYGIPEDAFLITYVGRHNEIKGYNNLKKIGKDIVEEYSNVYFLIAGKEEPITGLKHKRWIEAGWTNDPHSIVSASDMFILPNQETYFDLVLLEVLSLGIPVLLSNTGGNKYFKKFNSDSLMIYDNLEQAKELIENFMKKDSKERKELGLVNKQIFDNNFTTSIFAKEYIKIIRTLM